MQAEEKKEVRPPKKSSFKKVVKLLKLLFVILLILVVSAFFLIPKFVSSQTAHKIISKHLSESVDGKIIFGNLSMSWLNGIEITDINFSDNSSQISAQIKEVKINPDYRSIISGKLSFAAKIALEKAIYDGLDFGQTQINAQFENKILNVSPFSTAFEGGQLNFAGQVNFANQPAVLKITKPIQIMQNIKIDDETTDRFLAYINPIFANAVNVSGILNFNCKKLTLPLSQGYENQIEAIGTISIEQIQLQTSGLLNQILSLAGIDMQGQYITIHPTKFVLHNGFLSYEDMQMDIGNNPVNFRGTIGLDKSLDMIVILPYTSAGRTARIGQETIGERISLPLKGTIDKPELDLDKLLEKQLNQLLKKEIDKQVEKYIEEQIEGQIGEILSDAIDELFK